MAIDLSQYLARTWAHKSGLGDKIKAILLSAGLGKRMDPLTAHHLPKPMFPIGGSIPMAELWVHKFIEAGITDISMNLCVLSETIKNHFGDGAKYGARISFVEEDEPSGTFGGVCKQVLGNKAKRVSQKEGVVQFQEFTGDTIIVASGDIVTNFTAENIEEMYAIHRKKGAAFSIILTPIPWGQRSEFGTVELINPQPLKSAFSQMGQVASFREKDANSPSNLNNGSIYMIEADLVRALDQFRTPATAGHTNAFYDFGKHVFPALLKNLDYVKLSREYPIWGIEYNGLWFDVGRKRDYLDVNEAFLDGKISLRVPYERLPWGYLGTNVTIDFSKIDIHPPVVIGNDCVIEPEAVLGPHAVIGAGWTIERGACVAHSVLWPPYDYYADDGGMVTSKRRHLVDRHEIRGGTQINNCIIVGGTIQQSLSNKTVDVLEDGNLKIVDIAGTTEGLRA